MQRITKELVRVGRGRNKIEFLVRPISNIKTEPDKKYNSNIHDRNMTSKMISGKPHSTENVEVMQPMQRWKDDKILFYDIKDKGLITLNNPKSLNALQTSMCEKMTTILKEWESSKKLVILKGAGERALCCGGDLNIMKYTRPENFTMAAIFFNTIYKLFHLIGTYKVPIVALMNNMTMGGGAGLSIHTKYKVVTEKSIFAMPETAIGFFVDAGCSYFLPRLQGQLGLFLALTGYRLKGADIIHAGIATHYVPADRIQDLEQELLSSDNTNLDEILVKYETSINELEYGLSPYMEKINTCFSADSVEGIIERLHNDGSEWSKNVIKTLDKMSPTSLKITYQALQNGKKLSFKDCIKMEYNLAYSFISVYSDFHEGCRIILNKIDGKPNWNPKSLKEITTDDVLKRFTLQTPELEF